MFDETFKIAGMKATGKIKYEKDQVDFLSACIIQVDGAGKITGAAYGVATGSRRSISCPGHERRDRP